MTYLLALLWALVFGAVIFAVVLVWDRVVGREERMALAQVERAAQRQREFDAEKQAAAEHRTCWHERLITAPRTCSPWCSRSCR